MLPDPLVCCMLCTLIRTFPLIIHTISFCPPPPLGKKLKETLTNVHFTLSNDYFVTSIFVLAGVAAEKGIETFVNTTFPNCFYSVSCDLTRITSLLRSHGFIDEVDYKRMCSPSLKVSQVNSYFFLILKSNPSYDKLVILSQVLKMDATHPPHQWLSEIIDQFLGH